MENKTKHTLLKVTRELIDREGIDALSMRTVGTLAGLSRTALYRHFENKESVLAAIVVENFIVLGEMIGKLEENATNPRQLLSELFTAFYSFGINNPDHYQLMFNTKWDEVKFPDIWNAANGVFQKAVSLVSEALPSGTSSPRLSIEKTAILYAFIHGLVELHLAGHNEISKGLHDVKPLIHQLLDAILKE